MQRGSPTHKPQRPTPRKRSPIRVRCARIRLHRDAELDTTVRLVVPAVVESLKRLLGAEAMRLERRRVEVLQTAESGLEGVLGALCADHRRLLGQRRIARAAARVALYQEADLLQAALLELLVDGRDGDRRLGTDLLGCDGVLDRSSPPL
eukprot:1612288-Prymnesium_polylepis.2